MSARYSHLKAFKYPDRIAAIRAGTVSGPVHIQLILSDLCNQNCHFCCYRDASSATWRPDFAEGDNHNPNRMLPFGKVIEILDDAAEMGVRGIELTGGGEPTIHKHFAAIVDAINARGLKWGIVTNGVREQDLSSASWARVSLDAATPETYAKIRRVEPAHFKRSLATIERWRPSVSFVVTPDNWGEIYQAAVLVKSLGAQSFRIRPYQSVEGGEVFASFLNFAKQLAAQAVSLAGPGFDVDYQLDSELEALDGGVPDYDRCGFQYFKTWIGADENLYRCCILSYSPRGLIGSIKGRRFKDVWRELAVPGFAKFNARGCVNCRYNGINRTINEVVDPGPWDAFI